MRPAHSPPARRCSDWMERSPGASESAARRRRRVISAAWKSPWRWRRRWRPPWSAAPRPTPADLIVIAPAEPRAVPEPASAWERLSAGEQRLHLRAQRFARVQVAEMRLYHPAEVQTGRARRNLYDALSTPIDAARESFRKTYFDPCPSMVDYLHLELVRTLANDDPELLGENYPSAIV